MEISAVNHHLSGQMRLKQSHSALFYQWLRKQAAVRVTKPHTLDKVISLNLLMSFSEAWNFHYYGHWFDFCWTSYYIYPAPHLYHWGLTYSTQTEHVAQTMSHLSSFLSCKNMLEVGILQQALFTVGTVWEIGEHWRSLRCSSEGFFKVAVCFRCAEHGDCTVF